MNNLPNATETSRLPTHERVYREIRPLLLFGEMPPGTPVTIQGLAKRLDAGMTPVREAIRRLTAEGALVFQGNRRVSVPVLDAGSISELIHARVAIETELARRACKRADTLQLTELAAIDTQIDDAISGGDVRSYLENNFRFHQFLYGLAAAPILTELCEGLWLRFGPSLRVVCGRFGTQNLPDEHKALLVAMNRRDAEAAAFAIEKDVRQGIEQVRQTLA